MRDKILIHTCQKRRWYVDEFLVPSLKEQGIENISIYEDKNNNELLAFFSSLKDISCDTWHLQDDIIISSKFSERIQGYAEDEIVCAFSSMYDKNNSPGEHKTVDEMRYSFPCIRIPYEIAKYSANWFFNYAMNENEYRIVINSGRQDDNMFKEALKDYREDVNIINLAPNLVEHIDYLIGGSLVNVQRDRDIQVKSRFWDEIELEEKLKDDLTNNLRPLF